MFCFLKLMSVLVNMTKGVEVSEEEKKRTGQKPFFIVWIFIFAKNKKTRQHVCMYIIKTQKTSSRCYDKKK